MPVTRKLPLIPHTSVQIADASSKATVDWYSYFNEQRSVIDAMRVSDLYTSITNFLVTAEINDAANGLGTIDITTKVQTAIDSLTTGTVFFPPGVYLFGNVTLKPGVAILGAGRGATIINATANNCHIFDYVAAGTVSYFNISQMSFKANGFTGVRAISIDGTDETKRCVHVNVSDCYFESMEVALYRAYCANSFLSNLHAVLGSNGFWNDTCADTDMVNCRSQLASGTGFYIKKSTGGGDHSDEGTRLANCSTNGTAVGLFVDGANWGHVSNGSFTTCSGASCAAFVSADNWSWNGGDAASGAGTSGIIVDAASTNISITGVNCHLNDFGISFAGIESSAVNCKFAANTNSDIAVNGTATVIMGNVANSSGSSTFSFIETGGNKNIFSNNIVHQPVSIVGANSTATVNVSF